MFEDTITSLPESPISTCSSSTRRCFYRALQWRRLRRRDEPLDPKAVCHVRTRPETKYWYYSTSPMSRRSCTQIVMWFIIHTWQVQLEFS